MRTEREQAAAAILEHDRSAYKTLVVDDSNSIRRLIASYLEKDGFEIIQDINGLDAWNRLLQWKDEAVKGTKPLSANVSLVVTDIEMPAMLQESHPGLASKGKSRDKAGKGRNRAVAGS